MKTTTKKGEATKTDTETIIKDGMLLKEGGAPIRIRWQSRYLRVASGVAYYDKQKPSERQAMISYGAIPNLSKCTVAHLLDTPQDKKTDGAETIFTLETPEGRLYRFKAESEIVRDEWVVAFTKGGAIAGPGAKKSARHVAQQQTTTKEENKKGGNPATKEDKTKNINKEDIKGKGKEKINEGKGKEKDDQANERDEKGKEKSKEEEDEEEDKDGKGNDAAENQKGKEKEKEKEKEVEQVAEKVVAKEKVQFQEEPDPKTRKKNSKPDIKLNEPLVPLKDSDPDIYDICREISDGLTVSGNFKEELAILQPKFKTLS